MRKYHIQHLKFDLDRYYAEDRGMVECIEAEKLEVDDNNVFLIDKDYQTVFVGNTLNVTVMEVKESLK